MSRRAIWIRPRASRFCDLLCELNEAGKTIIMVTHEADIASRAKKRLHMRDGRVEAIEG